MNRAMAFISDLMEKRETIEDARKDTHNFVQSRRVRELIQYSGVKAHLLTRANNTELERFSWNEKILKFGE